MASTQAPTAAQPAAPISSPQTSSSPSQAFLDGYRAYRNHDLAIAVERLGYASDHFPRLATMRSTIAASRSATREIWPRRPATLEKLVRTYPESVTIADAEVALSDIYLRLTRASDAAAIASRAIARTAGCQNRTIGAARVGARAVAAEGNSRDAYMS